MRVPFGLMLLAVLGGCQRPKQSASPPASPTPVALTLEVEACRQCHQGIVDSYRQTAHFQTSARADSTSIKGSFAAGRNVLKTRLPSLSFRMDRRADGFGQTAADIAQMSSRSERFDIVVGSGRKGQSYLYWRDRILLQLPVSYLVGTQTWINSPGYQDGTADFDRVIPPRCLECHATSFSIEGEPGREHYSDRYQLGLSCEKCHGDARAHLASAQANRADSSGRRVINPATLPRDRKLDACGLCHSGPAKALQPAFTFQPGDRLVDFFGPDPNAGPNLPDVHGNQVALLRASQCFAKSPTMSCATCHNVHQPERDLAVMSGKCLQCHQPDRHPAVGLAAARLRQQCVDCHMPNQRSNAIQINTPTGRFGPDYRSHRIAVYMAGGRDGGMAGRRR